MRHAERDTQRAHTGGHGKWADFPYLPMLFILKHDGGIIVSAQPLSGERLKYDGGVIVEF
jgi:hypothetical protein